ncbi:MAG: MFS transporter [Kiritimatiellaeota bacterium]|nr:MFS transporter [Kiritimatiellota bacterium]
MTPLFSTRRFLPLFLTQFTGAFNDNFFRSAVLMLISYRMGLPAKYSETLINMAMGVFMLPYFLFSTLAGEIADKYNRAKIAWVVKVVELGIMCCLPLLLVVQDEFVFLAFLFVMGAQSTFFSPVKYALLPLELRDDELVAGNAYIEAGTYLAILIGTICGTLLVMRANGEAIVVGMLIVSGLAGVATSWFIPSVPAANPKLRVNLNFIGETWRIIQYVWGDRVIWWAILGISWFWVVGSVFLAQFPALCKTTLRVSETVVSLFLVLFAVGIGMGSLLCNRLLKGVLTLAYVPMASLGMAVSAGAFYFLTRLWTPIEPAGGGMAGILDFAREPLAWGMCLCLVFFTMCCGLYNVPQYVLMQSRTRPEILARVIAGNNIINSFFMVLAAGVCALLLHLGLPLPALFLVVGVLSLGVAAAAAKMIPRALSQVFLRAVFKVFFRLKMEGLEHFAAVAGDRVVVTPNHVSLLDGFLVSALLPGRIGFAIDEGWMRKWFMKILARLIYAVPVSTTSPLAMRALMAELRSGRTLVVFPEGRITTTGALMPLRPGAAMLAHKTDAWIVPVHIAGAERSYFSYLGGKIKRIPFPRITLTIGAPQKPAPPAGAQGVELRRALLEQHRAMMGK